MREQHTAILGALAERGLSSARDLHARQLAAETPEQASRLAFALHRISRSLRQTLALQARLDRDAERAVRDDAAERVDLAKARTERRKAQVKAAVQWLIWVEHEKEGDDADHLVECLDDMLGEDLLHDDFDAEPVEAHIARMCSALGLPSPPAGEGVGQGPTDEGSHADRHHNSSPPDPDSPEKPLIRPADAGHLLPQGEKDDDPLLSDDDWRASG